MNFDAIRDRWETIPKWQKWIAYAVLLLILSGIFFKLSIQPKLVKRDILSQEVASYRTRVAQLRIIEQRKKALEKEIARLKEKTKQIEKVLPTGKEDVGTIIKTISENATGLEVIEIQRGKPIEKKYYEQIPYKITLNARYPEFVKWCERLMKADRILTLGKFNIKSRVPPIRLAGQNGMSRYTMEATFTINAYVLRNKPLVQKKGKKKKRRRRAPARRAR